MKTVDADTVLKIVSTGSIAYFGPLSINGLQQADKCLSFP